MRLDQLCPGDEARVVDLEGGHGLRRRLNHYGIHPGDTVHLDARGAFRGPLLVVVHGARVALGRGVARRVLVELLSERDTARPCPRRRWRRGAR